MQKMMSLEMFKERLDGEGIYKLELKKSRYKGKLIVVI